MIFPFKQDKLSEIDWSTVKTDRSKKDSERYIIAKEAFLSRYSSPRLARKLLSGLETSNDLLLALRHGEGRAHVIERFIGYVSGKEKKRHLLDKSYDTVEKIILPLINHGRITSFERVEAYWSHVRDDSPDHAFDSFDWLARSLPKADEWTLREICFRTDLLAARKDDFFALEEVCGGPALCDRVLANYKKIKENILNKDFDEARQEHGERQRRFSSHTGEGSKFKEVKVRLTPDLVDVLNETIGGGNRTAWIEDAIVQKLHSLGVEYEPVEQPPLPPR